MGSPLEYLDAMADGLKGAVWLVLGPMTALLVGVALGAFALSEGEAIGFVLDPSAWGLVLLAPFGLVLTDILYPAGWCFLLVYAILGIIFWMSEERRRGLWFLLCLASVANVFALDLFAASGGFRLHERSLLAPIILFVLAGALLLGCYLLLRFRERIGDILRPAFTKLRHGRKPSEATTDRPRPEEGE
jgi:hypothetical protein